MTNTSGAGGDALDAFIDTASAVPDEDPVVVADRNVAAATAKVEKEKAFLAGAEEALQDAQAARAALNEGA